MKTKLFSIAMIAIFLPTLACDSQSASDATKAAVAVTDKERYAALVEEECARGEASSCTSVGVQTAFGTYGREKDHAAAIPFLVKGCDGGDPRGCHNLGAMYMYGRGVELDYARARELFEGGCEAEVANSCHYLGQFYEKGRGVEPDAAKAKEYYDLACAAGSTSSCDKEIEAAGT